MPKQIYKKSIKKIDNEIKKTSKKIIKLQDKRYKFIQNVKKGKKINMKQFTQNNTNQKEIRNLQDKNIQNKRLKRKFTDKLMKAEKKGLI